MTPLCLLAKKYGADKYRTHRYTPIYYRLLGERRETVERVLEIGIGKGRGLFMWRDFFPQAMINGIDIDREKMIEDWRIRSFYGDQSDNRKMADIGDRYGPFHVIVDDGDHAHGSQVAAMKALLPYLARDGFYFIEDVRYTVDPIVTEIPLGYRWEAYEGEKRLPSGLRKGRSEVLMMIQPCST